MEERRAADSPKRLLDEQLLISSDNAEEHHDASQLSPVNVSDPPRKRSNSVLQWVQKTFTHGKPSHGHHKHSPSRPRSATATQHSSDDTSRRSPPVTRPVKSFGRPRASTFDSIGSTNKKAPPMKKILSDTDERAQQTPSIFQYAFGR